MTNHQKCIAKDCPESNEYEPGKSRVCLYCKKHHQERCGGC